MGIQCLHAAKSKCDSIELERGVAVVCVCVSPLWESGEWVLYSKMSIILTSRKGNSIMTSSAGFGG